MVETSLHEISFQQYGVFYEWSRQWWILLPMLSKLQGSLVVQKLPSIQTERIVPQWLPFVLCWWSQLAFFQRPSLLAKTHQDESENHSMRQCLSQNKAPIKSRLQHSPQATHGYLTVVLSWGTWTLYGWGGLFEPDLSSSSSGIHLFYLLIWSCLKVKSSLSRADTSQGKVSKKVTVADLAFYKQIDHQIRHLVGHLNTTFSPGRREFEGGTL